MTIDDTPHFANNNNVDEVVRPAGRVARFFIVAGTAVGLAVGPALVILVLLLGVFEWRVVVIAVVWSLLFGVPAVKGLRDMARVRRRAERVQRNGRPAVARVTESRWCEVADERGLEFTLLIEGPEVPVFETTRREINRIDHEVGDEFDVLVDPRDNIYRIL